MELRVKLHPQNTYPLGALLIRGTSPCGWLAELQRMGLSPETSAVYVLPGTLPNSLWGCLVKLPAGDAVAEPGPNEVCQVADGLLFLPERAALFPALAEGELGQLLRNVPHLLHPELGLVELADRIDWVTLLTLPAEQPMQVRCPAPTVTIPERVRSFRVVPMAPEEALAQLTGGAGNPTGEPISKPLSWTEKLGLELLNLLFRKGKEEDKTQPTGESTPVPAQPTGLSKILASLTQFVTPKTDWLNQWQADFEQLTGRNQKQLDQLLKLLRENPELALKYALPLDPDGTSRGGSGGNGALFNWSVRWLDFSLLGNTGTLGRGGSGPTLEDQQFAALQAQYNQTASRFVQAKDYQKAAFVYLNLLKDPTRAAQTLEDGKLYQEAAALHLTSLNNKKKAAECYEKGKMQHEAIALYKDLGDYEKVGDLYCAINRPGEAMPHYQRVVDGYVGLKQYVKASLLCRYKMDDPGGAQHLLLNGWRVNLDAFNCLNNYFAGIADQTALHQAIETVYVNDVSGPNRESFLQILRHEFDKKPDFSDRLRAIAYEVIAAEAPTRPNLLTQLKAFNPADNLVLKDVLRYRSGK